MNSLQSQIKNYLEFCEYQKRLDRKTIKAYRIDLQQFSSYFETAGVHDCTEINYEQLEKHIASMHEKYRPKTVKRKIASEKSFFHYLEYRKIIPVNPFTRMHVHFRESIILPRTIPLHSIENFLRAVYSRINSADTEYKRKRALRDAAVTELLFATGMRISELCSLKNNDADLKAGTVMIYGKGRKERLIHIGNECVINILKEYKRAIQDESGSSKWFFTGQLGQQLSDQSVRRMINKYASIAGIEMHITPHMFRHTFATSLLEAGVDIRYIQDMLGHSSISITQIYTHVTVSKQKDILSTMHPRKDFCICVKSI